MFDKAAVMLRSVVDEGYDRTNGVGRHNKHKMMRLEAEGLGWTTFD
jgi:hypothetical protein